MKKILRIYSKKLEEKKKETFLDLYRNEENGNVYLKEVDEKGMYIRTLLRVTTDGEIISSLCGATTPWRWKS